MADGTLTQEERYFTNDLVLPSHFGFASVPFWTFPSNFRHMRLILKNYKNTNGKSKADESDMSILFRLVLLLTDMN